MTRTHLSSERQVTSKTWSTLDCTKFYGENYLFDLQVVLPELAVLRSHNVYENYDAHAENNDDEKCDGDGTL